ncbi:hypothetical protein U722_06805 [Bacillus amyloliquefaciens LFB112]|nr:hypothetical protein U722_06805 [Bacillus amyloliquefaciens LFB112]
MSRGFFYSSAAGLGVQRAHDQSGSRKISVKCLHQASFPKQRFAEEAECSAAARSGR